MDLDFWMRMHPYTYLCLFVCPSAFPPVSVSLRILNVTFTAHIPPQYGPIKVSNSNEVNRLTKAEINNCITAPSKVCAQKDSTLVKTKCQMSIFQDPMSYWFLNRYRLPHTPSPSPGSFKIHPRDPKFYINIRIPTKCKENKKVFFDVKL